jgi:hypothetical protein
MTGSINVKEPAPKFLRPGDTAEVTFEWRLTEAPASIEARLFWYTSGKGTQDLTIVETQPASPVAHGEQRFRFKLPQAPYSFSGTLITLSWAVELVAGELAERWEFVLAPEAREITLARLPDPARAAFELRKAEYARSR